MNRIINKIVEWLTLEVFGGDTYLKAKAKKNIERIWNDNVTWPDKITWNDNESEPAHKVKAIMEALDYAEVKTIQGYSAYASVNSGTRQDMVEAGIRIGLRKARQIFTEQLGGAWSCPKCGGMAYCVKCGEEVLTEQLGESAGKIAKSVVFDIVGPATNTCMVEMNWLYDELDKWEGYEDD